MADNKVSLVFGMLVVLTLIGGTIYTLTDIEKTYYCESKNLVAMCDKLSSQVNGTSTRCYYNSTKYYSCTSGWKPLKNFPEIINNMTITGEELANQTIIEPVNLVNKTINNRTFYIIEVTPYPNIPSSKIMKCEWKGELT